MLELHLAVPARGAVLVSINVRLSIDEMTYILKHSGASLLVATEEFADAAQELGHRAGIPVITAGATVQGDGHDGYEE